MAGTSEGSGTRAAAITRDRIAAAAVELLDAAGEDGLTYRALAKRLETGHGALQWHVANKADLLRAASAAVLAQTVHGGASGDLSPRQTVHIVALGVFDAIEAHPWLGGQLVRPPWQDTMLQIFERIGRAVQALGAAPAVQFTATSTLLIYIIGAGSQEASNSRSRAASHDRRDALHSIGVTWMGLEPDAYPFTQSMVPHLQAHDDRTEFLAGIDLIIDGLTGPDKQHANGAV